MRRFTRALAAVAVLFFTTTFGLSGSAGAQDEPQIDQDVLDALRAEIPEGAPGASDLVEGDGRFGELVSLLGESTEVADFGTESTLTGSCGGWAYSYDKDGQLLDAAIDFGDDSPPIDLLEGVAAFTADNPFMVDSRGLVQYYGFHPQNDEGPKDHEWYIKTADISLDKGGDPNSAGNNRNEGIVDLAEDLPVKFSATVRIEGRMDSANLEPCIGKGHVEFQGNLTDPAGLAGIALLAGGTFGLLFNARPAMTFRG